jgi:hypothetical protein
LGRREAAMIVLPGSIVVLKYGMLVANYPSVLSVEEGGVTY